MDIKKFSVFNIKISCNKIVQFQFYSFNKEKKSLSFFHFFLETFSPLEAKDIFLSYLYFLYFLDNKSSLHLYLYFFLNKISPNDISNREVYIALIKSYPNCQCFLCFSGISNLILSQRRTKTINVRL